MKPAMVLLRVTMGSLAVLLAVHRPARAELDRAVLIQLSASVLKIEVLRAQGGFSLGSGVVVAPEHIVTNCHVTRDALKINVLRGDVRWLASAQQSDVKHDLCLLQVPGLRATAVPVGRANSLAAGQPVVALGYTGGLGLQMSPGDVMALHRFDGAPVIQSSNWFSSGASGGGLFDEDLRLVGILTFRLRGGEAHYFAAPAEWVQAMLDAPAAKAYADVAPEASREAPYWQRPAAEQPAFLKAAIYQQDGRWTDLESLTTDWLHGDATDPEPWYLLGMSLARQNRLPEARHALECAMATQPPSAAAQARLASVDQRLALIPLARPCGALAASARAGSGSLPEPSSPTPVPPADEPAPARTP
ncbi:hypothetical protein BH11PSE8_BH11PSE8_40920 [soil metagenome]